MSPLDQNPERVAEKLRDLVIEHGLQQASAITDTHTVTIREPAMFEPGPDLTTVIEQHDL